jgi:hypothetical protein
MKQTSRSKQAGQGSKETRQHSKATQEAAQQGKVATMVCMQQGSSK